MLLVLVYATQNIPPVLIRFDLTRRSIGHRRNLSGSAGDARRTTYRLPESMCAMANAFRTAC